MFHNSHCPDIDVDPKPMKCVDGVLLTCEPASKLPMAQRYFLLKRIKNGSVSDTMLLNATHTRDVVQRDSDLRITLDLKLGFAPKTLMTDCDSLWLIL